jgi:hypothetical protein
VVLFLLLICVPSIALVILGPNPSASTFDHVAWIFAAYFAVAWLLLGIIIRPEQVTRPMLILMTVVALATQVPLAVTLEVDLHADTAGLGPSIWSVGLPEELAKAIPVLAVAVIYWLWGRHELTPKDYLFLGAVSGLVFGASEVVHYFTVNGLEQFYLTVQSALPSIQQMILYESGALSAHVNGVGCSSDMMKQVCHAVVLCRRGGDRGSPLGGCPNRAGVCRRQRSWVRRKRREFAGLGGRCPPGGAGTCRVAGGRTGKRAASREDGCHARPGGDARGLAFLELSTHPGREQGAVHLQDLVLEPDEGLIPRIGLIQRGMRSAGRTSGSDDPADLTVPRGRAAFHEGLARRGPEGADLAGAGRRGWSADLSVLIVAPAWRARTYPDE